MKNITIILLLVSLLVIPCYVSAITINVPDNYSTIQDGISASSSSDTVLVQPGIYVENINFNGKNIVIGSLFLTSGDTSYVSSTIIDGDSSGSVATFENGEDSTAMLIGFTLRNGLGGDLSQRYSGSGITCKNFSSPTVSSNVISFNFSGNYFTGAIYCYNYSEPRITDNYIFGNISSGIYCEDESNPVITNNKICENTESGILCNQSNPYINDNLINDNSGNHGAGIYCFTLSDAEIINNTISNNHTYSEGDGGGIYASMGSFPSIEGNTISDNTADRFGGGIFISSDVAISNNIISGNTATTQWGGGIYIWGASPTIIYNTITGNTALYHGGGISCYESESVIMNNTISGNYVEYTGGGLICYDSYPTVVNTIFWANNADTSDEEIDLLLGSSIDMSYCDIQNIIWPGEGNISCDPAFCNPDSNDYFLADTSCCVGTGEGDFNIGAYGIGCGGLGLEYLPGDANMPNGLWPPSVIGADVTYLVNYFRAITFACELDGFYCSADTNGDCLIIGSDVTRLVNYFRGSADLSYCAHYEPAWHDPSELPPSAPSGWPNCGNGILSTQNVITPNDSK
ncbi:MAG: hypothetical protein GY839_11865 [candidate division Zixibacteria bacterium]|nr:hypothetical protein [candidate division Zixibacteria bacterium]